MRNRTLFIAVPVFIACAAGLGVYLAPNHGEVALMKMEDNRFHDALAYYSRLQAAGDNSVNVLAPLVRLYVHYGDVDKAIGLAQEFVAKNPRSVDGHRWLADLDKSSERFYAYCSELETLQTLAPSADTLRELADTYDFLGQYKQEMQALARLVQSPGYHEKEEDYARLASFYRVDHQNDNAIRTLVAYINLKRSNVQPETMQLAVQLLLEKGDGKQAFSLASAFLNKYGKENDALTLASLFREQDRLDDAYALLTPYLAGVDRSPELLEQLVTLQLAQGKQKEAYGLLSAQYAKGILPEEMTVTLMDLALKYNNYAMWEKMLRAVPLKDLPPDALLRYADTALQNKRADLAQAMQKGLGDAYLHDAPLISAVLADAASDTPQAEAALLRIAPKSISTPEQKMIMADLYYRHGYAARAKALFEGMPVSDMLDTLDPQQVAELYLNADQADRAEHWLADARAGSAPAVQAQIDQALLFLAAGEGKTDAIRQWQGVHPKDDGKWLDDAYDMAVHYHRPEMALVLAERIYQRHATPANRMQLADAQLMNHRYADAIASLQPLAGHDAQARQAYLDAMSDWIHQAGVGALGDNRQALEAFITLALGHADLSQQEKRNLAYLLEQAKFTDKAETLFFELAANQPFGSDDVNELLNFWGNHPSPTAIAWMENRARGSAAPQKAAWLHYLNAIEHPQSVLAVLGSERDLTPALTNEYIDALASTHDRRLGGVLAQEMSGEKNPVRLKHLATVAEQEDFSGVAEQGWRRLLAMDPGNADAAKEIGLMDFDASRYTEAKALLDRYLSANRGKTQDYRVNYAYAEILQHLKKKDEAQSYFARAEDQVAQIKDKNISAQLDQAHLLYRNNHLEQALDLYRRLLAQHPQDKTVRADFAEVLIETKQFDEASLVLQ